MPKVTGIKPNPEDNTYREIFSKKDVPCKCTIGGAGVKDKFVPNINFNKWNDEAWLNINCPDVVSLEKEFLYNKSISSKLYVSSIFSTMDFSKEFILS